MRPAMALPKGTKLGPYEISAPLAAGGMGEVYRARDARLDREVALKVLPESFSADADRLRRFEQEARSIATLNHPNILSVHDVGTQDGTHYIVTELLQGSTLREKLISGPIPTRRTIEIAIQVAQGLAAAHEKGIVHRDLKPDNLFLTQDSRAKILDFGLAKRTESALQPNDATRASSMHTSAGMLLGTVGYMSPEQVRGELVDHRSDIFALGTVLYEMLTGKPAFRRNSSVETMTAILNEEPAELASASQPPPPALQHIVHRCLEKDPNQRFQSAKDLSFALESIAAGSPSQATPIQLVRRSRRALALPLTALALVLIFLAWRAWAPPPKQPVWRQMTFGLGYLSTARFGPDGQTIVYSAAWDTPQTKIYTSRTNGTEIRPLDSPPARLLAISGGECVQRKPHSPRAACGSGTSQPDSAPVPGGSGTAEPGGRTGSQQEQVSTTDPDSTYATKGGMPARLGCYDNYLVDNQSCVIVGVQATAARMSQETVAAQDMLTRFAQWQGRAPESVAADTTYGNGEFLQWLADRNVIAYMRTRDSALRKNNPGYGPKRFLLAREQPRFIASYRSDLSCNAEIALMVPKMFPSQCAEAGVGEGQNR